MVVRMDTRVPVIVGASGDRRASGELRIGEWHAERRFDVIADDDFGDDDPVGDHAIYQHHDGGCDNGGRNVPDTRSSEYCPWRLLWWPGPDRNGGRWDRV